VTPDDRILLYQEYISIRADVCALTPYHSNFLPHYPALNLKPNPNPSYR
jgi:hypothetical protein